LPTQVAAFDSQQAQTPQSYTPIYPPLDQPWQDVSLLPLTNYQTGEFITENVSQLPLRLSTNTFVRPASEYKPSSETDRYL